METSKIRNFWGAQKSAKISDQSVQITLIIVSAVLLLALIGFSVFTNLIPSQTINANGQSTIEVTPDLVKIYFNAETTGSTTGEANDKNIKIVDDLITSLVKLGLERKDIVTENINIYPEYSWTNNQQKITGYRAQHNIKVQLPVSDTSKIGSIIDAGANSGVQISYINFELSPENQNKYKAQALKEATEDARIKAESIASGLGKSLGRVYSVSTSSYDYNPWPIYQPMGVTYSKEDAIRATTNIQPGQKTINANVDVVYKIR